MNRLTRRPNFYILKLVNPELTKKILSQHFKSIKSQTSWLPKNPPDNFFYSKQCRYYIKKLLKVQNRDGNI